MIYVLIAFLLFLIELTDYCTELKTQRLFRLRCMAARRCHQRIHQIQNPDRINIVFNHQPQLLFLTVAQHMLGPNKAHMCRNFAT